jgi:hypothetical protein
MALVGFSLQKAFSTVPTGLFLLRQALLLLFIFYLLQSKGELEAEESVL